MYSVHDAIVGQFWENLLHFEIILIQNFVFGLVHFDESGNNIGIPSTDLFAGDGNYCGHGLGG